MIKPTVSRMVHFWRFAPQRANDQPEAAIVTYVWADDLVNLCVFGADGYPRSEQRVPLYQGEPQVKPRSRYCEWMAYQKGQAAKTDELQETLRRQGIQGAWPSGEPPLNRGLLARELDREEGSDGV